MFIFAISSFAQQIGSFTDSRDGKTYKTVKIGTQTWMAENLAFKADSGCWAYNDDQNNVKNYGYLYSWGTAKNVCPTGWHLPSDAEWTTLINNFGGVLVAGEKMKSKNGWNENGNGTNTSGFTALPGGLRAHYGTFYDIGYNGNWWSSTEYDIDNAWHMGMDGKDSVVYRNTTSKPSGFSVRCVSDY